MSKRLNENHVGDIIELDGRRGEVTSVFTTRLQGQEYPSIMVEFDDNPGYEEDIYGEDFKVIQSGRHANSWLHDDLNENHIEKGFTIAYPNGDFYIGKPMDLYTLMTDFLIDWDYDKTTMTEYEAEDVASIRDNYEKVFYAALEGGNYWDGQDFEETFGRHADYGIANALSNSLNKSKQDYYQDEILGRSLRLRDLLNIEFPLNALTNELGEYLGYDEEDFTREELDSLVIVNDIYTDADGFIGAEIKFESRDLKNLKYYRNLAEKTYTRKARLREDVNETFIGPDMNKLLEFEEGWIVGISAAKGEDSDIDNRNNYSLEKELIKLGLDFIGPNISMWDGTAEEGFLVNVHSDLNLERLYDLGNIYEQDWVAVWEAPLELGKTVIQVDFKENHTMLDGKAYSIVSNDISRYEATDTDDLDFGNLFESKSKLNENTEEAELYIESVSAGISLFVNGKQYITPETFNGPYSNNGFIYKSFKAFDKNEGICYIPEHAFDGIKPVTDEIKEYLPYLIDKEKLRGRHWYAVEDFGDNAYTKKDIVNLILSPEYNELLTIYGLEKNIKNAKRLSEIVFEEIDWQFPETYLNEALYMLKH